MPIEIPTSVRPVRIRRRMRPRATTVKKVIQVRAGIAIASRSDAIRPSLMDKTLEARRAIVWSWVTRTRVIRLSLRSRSIRSRTSRALTLSRLPVGSSARGGWIG
jgi:hypothetical protein